MIIKCSKCPREFWANPGDPVLVDGKPPEGFVCAYCDPLAAKVAEADLSRLQKQMEEMHAALKK